jgi:hypothetical protein
MCGQENDSVNDLKGLIFQTELQLLCIPRFLAHFDSSQSPIRMGVVAPGLSLRSEVSRKYFSSTLQDKVYKLVACFLFNYCINKHYGLVLHKVLFFKLEQKNVLE